MRKLRLLLFLLLTLSGYRELFSQAMMLHVRGVSLFGNDITKDFIILRELDLRQGDSIFSEDVASRLLMNRNRVFNTGLFTSVEIVPVFDSIYVDLKVEVNEKWYIWPFPVLKFADRNFNIWWETKDIGRLNVGLNVHHYNFRGRGEKLRITALWGYTRLIDVDYEIPYINQKKTKGLQFRVGHSSNKEIWYKAEQNRLQFLFDPNQRAIRYSYFELAYLYRPQLYEKHRFSTGLEDIIVSDTVLHPERNPAYLAGNRAQQVSLFFNYTFRWDRRDIAFYPLRGHYLELSLTPRYLVLSKSVYASFRLNAEKFFDLNRGFYAGFGLRAKLSAPEDQPYNLYPALGYKFFVRGFEPYVVDGQHYGLLQSSFKYNLWNKVFTLPWITLKQFKTIPLGIFVGVHADAGYVRSTLFTEPGNDYQNRWLQGFGAGIDFISYYDRVLRVEYSVNGFGLKQVYLHFTAPI